MDPLRSLSATTFQGLSNRKLCRVCRPRSPYVALSGDEREQFLKGSVEMDIDADKQVGSNCVSFRVSTCLPARFCNCRIAVLSEPKICDQADLVVPHGTQTSFCEYAKVGKVS